MHKPDKLKTFDEANYYEGDQVSVGGVEINVDDQTSLIPYKGNDHSIAARGAEILRNNSAIDASNILLSVHEGDIVLNGEIPDHEQKLKAAHCLKKIPGINKILNKLEIGSSL